MSDERPLDERPAARRQLLNESAPTNSTSDSEGDSTVEKRKLPWAAISITTSILIALVIVVLINVQIGAKKDADAAYQAEIESRRQDLANSCIEVVREKLGVPLENATVNMWDTAGASYKVRGRATGGEFDCLLDVNGAAKTVMFIPASGEMTSWTAP